MFKLNRHGDDSLPLHLQHRRLHKGNSAQTSTTSQETDTFTDQSTGDLFLPEAAQGVQARLSNVTDSDLILEIQQHGLNGEDLRKLLQPAGEALEKVSGDIAKSSSASAAFSNTVTESIESVKDIFNTAFEKTKDVLSDPLAQLAAAGGVVYLVSRRKRKNRKGK